MSRTFYLTTPLYYVNGVPHVGHAYTSVIADAIARYKRLCGLDVVSLTGTDEHGLKIERAAQEQGMEPQQLADTYANSFKQAWEKLGLTFDESIRTTQKKHHKAVADIFTTITNNKFIYLGEYSGLYCVSCEAYVPEGEENCPDCGRPTESMAEESYFFKLSEFQEKLLNFYAENPNFIIPASRMNEIVSFVKGGLRDLSISRTSFRWGIPVPNDSKHIFYVWFDALTGYFSGIDFGQNSKKFEQCWPADVQLIGKDILRFHAVYWPAFLMAANLEPPRHLLVHGWWTVDGEKMSKSRGNTVTVDELLDLAQPDYIKYFLLKEISVGADGNFSYELLMTRVNSDLANDLGNLCNRILKMIDSYFEGKIPEVLETKSGDEELKQFTVETIDLYRANFDNLAINKAINNVWELISTVNKYLVANEPWKLAEEVSQKDRLSTVLYYSAECLRIIAVLLAPVIPDGCSSILKQLGVEKSLDDLRVKDLVWGGTKSASKLGKIEAVYPRLDPKEFFGRVEKSKQQRQSVVQEKMTNESSSEEGKIGIEDFSKVEMLVGKVITAEKIKKSNKLLKVQVDIGAEVRQVVAGIGKEYTPEDLIGRLVVVVTNLKPAKLMGVESDGMIVAANDGDKPVLVNFTEPIKIGSRLK